MAFIMAQDIEIVAAIFENGRFVEAFLYEHFDKDNCRLMPLREIAEYSSSDIGMRLRPFLLRIAYEADTRTFDDVLPVAAGIELIQISTLVVDDVIDDSSMRNGKPSIFSKWGTSVAITAGVSLASEGLTLVAETLENNSDLKNRIGVFRQIAQTHTDIYIGQYLDVIFEGNTLVPEQHYMDMIQKTTASFICTSLVVGAMLRDADTQTVAILRDIGFDFGTAYQLRDDVIDIIGDSEFTGKPPAIDVTDRKMRLPVIHALASLPPKERGRLIDLYEGKEALDDVQVEEVICLLNKAKSIEYTIEKVKAICSKADEAINRLSPEHNSLISNLQGVSSLISCFGNRWD